jgi:peptidoglycan/LPS O-acetylase OafA/YrhL
MSNLKSTTATIEKPTPYLVVLAWIVILVGFETPAIILRFFVPAGASEPYIPSWMLLAELVFYAGFWLATRVFSSLKPLSGFTLALFALVLGSGFIEPAILHSAIYSNWLNEASWGMRQLGITGLKLITVALMALTLIGSGIGRRELFLTRGEPRALAKPTPFLPALKETQPWNKVVRSFLPFYVGGMLIVLWLQIRPDASQFTRMLTFLPAIILAAAINAFAEEFEARSMLLDFGIMVLPTTPTGPSAHCWPDTWVG